MKRDTKIQVFDDHALVPLQGGLYATIDVEDIPLVSGFAWSAMPRKRTWYAITGRNPLRRMHRVILGLTDASVLVDHIDGDGLNNRRSNLRTCTNLQNSSNMRKPNRDSSSQYKGVLHINRKKEWKASITYNGNVVYIGVFDCEHCAALAYDKKALEFRGEFANLNFPKATLR